jgi:prepilin-type processing-associated H-X9-DG protein
VNNTFLCPSDGKNGNGLLPHGAPGGVSNGTGQYPDSATPLNPFTGAATTVVPVSNYAGSFGDNYCGGPLLGAGGGLPWETKDGTQPLPGQPRIGHYGFWGTTTGVALALTGGSLRGFFDYRTQQTVGINSVTDGTSNTIIVGEVLPSRVADSNFWHMNGSSAGTTVPLNHNSDTVPGNSPACKDLWQAASAPLGCRFGAAAKGFASMHPGGANFSFADGSVKFLKASLNIATYCALGSRNGGEVLSADAY